MTGGISRFNHNKTLSLYKPMVSYAPNAGIFYNYNYNKKIQFGTGINFNTLGARFSTFQFDSNNEPLTGTQVELYQKYLISPLIVGYKFPISEKLDFRLNTGLCFGFLLAEYNETSNTTTSNIYAKHFIMNVIGKLQLNYYLGNKFIIGINLYYLHGLNDYLNDYPFKNNKDFHKSLDLNFHFGIRI